MREKTGLKKIEVFPRDVNFLILEDMDNYIQQMIKDLRTLGVTGQIFEAPDVKTAIALCSKEAIGFVMSDWNLPDGTGHDFLKKFMASARYKTTPFIMCTTNSEISYFLEAVQSGANDFIVKPWEIAELKKKIQMTWDTYLHKKSKG